jgi:hypothetical protein
MRNKLLPRITNQICSLIVKFPFSAPQSVFKIYQLGQYRKFLRNSGIQNYPLLEDRNALYEYIHKNHVGGSAIDYLEFGVFEGESIKKWMELNAHQDSRFLDLTVLKDYRRIGRVCRRGILQQKASLQKQTTSGQVLSRAGSMIRCQRSYIHFRLKVVS